MSIVNDLQVLATANIYEKDLGKIRLGQKVNLGQITGDLAEVKTGLFAGDRVVTQRGMLLYAQSLRGGSKPQPAVGSKPVVAEPTIPVWGWVAGAGVIGAALWAIGRRKLDRTEAELAVKPEILPESTTTVACDLAPVPTSDLNGNNSDSTTAAPLRLP